jgi:two-component system sensor histidine kinase YesM
LIPPEKTQIKFINDRSVFLVIRCLKTIEENDIVGYITVASSIDVLNNILLSNIPPGSDIMIEILDQYGNLVTYVGNKSISNNEKGGISVTFIKQTSDICGWSTIVYVPNSAINLNLVGIKKDTIVVWGVVIFCSVILIVFISRHTLKPLSHFVQSMNKVENGDFDIKLDYSGLTYEVRQLYKGFNKMVNEIKNLIKNLNEEKLLVKTAQIEALQFQINPHFLYNTLQTMESIGEVKGVPEIQTISNSLGNLLRYNIQGKNIVSINDEIKQIITYFTIQKIRFGDKLDYFIHIDDEIKNCKILKFILQPLVENSMVHGLDGIEGTGLIVINGVNNNGVIQIEISDNGKGIDHQKMNEINRKLEIIRTSKPFIMDDKCVGILNVQKRLVNFYGKEYGIRYKNCTQGTVVVINIPAIFDDEE